MPLSVFAEGGLKHSKHVNDLTRPSRTTQVNIPPLVKVKSLSRVQLFATPRTVAYQAPPSMGFSRPECWSGLPFPSPGDLPDPGIEPRSPALRRRFTVWATREAHYLPYLHVIPLKVYSLWMKADRNKKIMESNKNLILEEVVLFKKITSKEKFVDKIWSIKRETIHVLLHANVLSWLAEKSWRIQKEVNRRVFHLGLKFGRIQDPVNIGKTV